MNKIKNEIEIMLKTFKEWRRLRAEKALCNKHRETSTVSGKCMGFSNDWRMTHPICIKCPEFFKNKTYVE